MVFRPMLHIGIADGVCTSCKLTKAKGLSSHVSGKRACNGHSTYIDSEILNVAKNIAQMFNEQASTGTFVPRVMVTYHHGKPLLAVPKAQKASLIVKTSETREHQSRSETVAVTNR